MYEFKLPDLGEGVHEGELLKWYVNEGDVIKEDDPLVDVETDKAAVTIPSPKGGTVVKVTGGVGDTLHVGQVIVVIDDGSGGEVAAPAKEAAPAAVEAAAVKAPDRPEPVVAHVASDGSPAAATVRTNGPIPAAPATRRLAREMGIDLSLVRATGPGGRVTMEDVKAYADGGAGFTPATAAPATASAPAMATEPAAPVVMPSGDGPGIPLLDVEPLPDFAEFGPVEREPFVSIRRKVARKMVTSMVLVPHVAHMDEADVTDLEALRQAKKAELAESGDRLTMLSFVMKALIASLRKFPMFNASLDPFRGQLVYKKYYNLGFAADTDKGLVVPVLKDVDKKNLLEISAGVRDLATRAREGTIGVEDYRGGSFTVTNVGSLGGTGMIPTINYPEVAILGMGKVQEKPVVRDGQIVVRKILPLTLAFDHRMCDGADAARFMNDLVHSLSDPVTLLMKL